MVTDRWAVWSITRAVFPILVVLTGIELGAGLALEAVASTLLRYPTLLVLVPVMIGTAGNLGAILSARLSTALHLGLLNFDPDDQQLRDNTAAAILLAASVYPVVGVGGWLLATLTGEGRLSLQTVLAVVLASGAALAILAVVITIMVAYAAYRAQVDPDDVVIPVVTNVCDVLGVVVLLAVVEVVV